ncbi:MAG TPA: glucose 1-dehydrogenase [Gaiellaceae bacterium]|nr:glucose 1-dehydrogenase [Gaiellaceae bacterium]
MAVALVTGGTSGIGRATAERFLASGWHVVVADVNAEAGRTLLDESGAPDGRLLFAEADVAEERDVEAAVRTAVDGFGRLDCMVNNAGVGGAFGPITEIEVADWDYTFGVLVRGVFLGTKHAARAMRRHGDGGSIVNVASVAGLVGGAAPQAYSAAKAAVIQLTRVTAAELGPFRIRVNAVAPGVVRTPLVEMGKRDVDEALAGVQPWPGVAPAPQVAGVIEFLAGPEAEFVTGETVAVDGGLVAAGIRLGDAVGGNPALRGLVGVNRGSTGAPSSVHRTAD